MILRLLQDARRPTTAVMLATPIALVAGWWLWSSTADSFFFPPLPEILDSFVDTWVFERFGSDVVPSLRRFGLGYVLACIFGVVIGVTIGLNQLVARTTGPLVEFMRAVPPVALLPFTIVVVGIDDRGKVFLIVLGSVWPILLNTIDGVRGVDEGLLDAARSYGASARQLIVSVRLPAALPQIMAGMRSSLSIALILTVISELWAATEGVGFFVLQAQRNFDMPAMWSGMVMLSIIGITLNAVFSLVNNTVLGWFIERAGQQEAQ